MSTVNTKKTNGDQPPAQAVCSGTEFDLNMHTAKLLMEEPFFASISRRIDKRASRGIPTAGVMVNPDTAQFEMLYNPDFFKSLTPAQRLAVLKHEFYHIIFKHITERMPDGVSRKKWNIATDLAINSHIQDLPPGGLIPGHAPFEDMPSCESAEWYLNNLPDDFGDCSGDGESGKSQNNSDPSGDSGSGSPGQPGNGNSPGDVDTLDDHSGWDKCSQEVKDIANERVKDIVRKAAEEASANNSWGSVSGRTRKEIMKSIQTKIDWRKVLRYFVKASQKANKKSSIRRINRRYPYLHPGKKADRVAKVAISIDQSGSVDDNMLSMFFAELNKLAELAEFTVIPFDSQVFEDKVYVWKKGERRSTERVLTGGTCFDAPTSYVNDRDFDGHIVLTDMYAPKPKRSKCQRMWMTTETCAAHAYFQTSEKVVAVDKN